MIDKDKIVITCKLCLMTNQKPFSINETKNSSSNQKKTTLQFGDDGICFACKSIEAKKSIDYQVSILEYLPKSTTVWTKDINYTKDILNDYFNKVSKEYEKKIEDNITQHLLPENILGLIWLNSFSQNLIVCVDSDPFFLSIKPTIRATSLIVL